jgi:hypothetical protein
MKSSVDINVELSPAEKDILLDAIGASLKEYNFVRGGETLRTIQAIARHNTFFVLKLPEIYTLIETLEAYRILMESNWLDCCLGDKGFYQNREFETSELKTDFEQILEENFNLEV